MTTRTHTELASPLGPLTVVSEDGALAALYMTEQRHRPDPATFGASTDPTASTFDAVAEQLAEYFAGDRREFDLPLAAVGTPFQRRVWQALLDIPYGETVTYGELAERLGNPNASRAVGLANGKNPISIIVPCHRVVGVNGDLTGYGGGVDRKRWLLDLEQGDRVLW